MARLWFTGSTTPYTPATVKGSWDRSSGADIQLLDRNPGGSVGTSAITIDVANVDRSTMLNRFISNGVVKTGNIPSGTAQMCIGAKASSTAMNAKLHIHAWVTVGNSDTVRGTLISNAIGSNTLQTTPAGVLEGSITVASVSVTAGDRIVIEVGYRGNSPTTNYSATINYGGTQTTDLTSGDTAVTTDVGWIDIPGLDGFLVAAIGTLADTFDTSFSSSWTASSGVSVTSGRARINATTAYPNLKTANSYEIQGSRAAFEVPTMPATGGGSGVNFSAYLMPGFSTTNLEINYSPNSGNIQFRNNVGGSDASPTVITYSSTSHRWLRFREASGNIYMETSPDNSTWTTQRTISTSGTQWMLRGNHIIYFEAGRSSGTADFAEVDNFNQVSASQTKIWNGSSWVVKPVKVWTGSAWVAKPLKVWTGTAWK